MKLTQQEFKVLKYINRFPSGISLKKLTRKFRRVNIAHILERLLQCGYIDCNCAPFLSTDGTCVVSSPDETLYTLTDTGIIEIESHKFFTFENIFQHLLAPIIVGVLSALITALILA